MKKLLLSALALLAGMTANAAEETVIVEQLNISGGWNWSLDETVDYSIGSGTGILFSNTYGEIGLCDQLPVDISGYTGFRVKVSFLNDLGGAGAVQAKVQNATMQADTQTYPAQYVGVNAEGIIAADFNTELFGDDTELTVFNLQGLQQGVAVSVDEFVLISADGEEFAFTNLAPNIGWGWSVYVDPDAGANISFTQWGQLGCWSAELDAYTTHKYTIELGQPASADELQWKWTNADGDVYRGITDGATVIEMTVDESYQNFSLQAKTACIYNVKSITRTITIQNPDDVDPHILWSKEEGQKVMWGGGAINISAVKAANLNVGDIIKVTVSEVTDEDAYPQFYPAKSEWGEAIEGAVLMSEPGVYSFVMTGDMVKFVKTNGFWLRGVAFVATEISYEEGDLTGSENSIWLGSNSFNEEWSGNAVNINKAHFLNNTVDAILVNFVGSGDEPKIALHYEAFDPEYHWVDINDAQIQYVDEGAIVNITPELAEIVQNSGLLINGKNLTVSSVDITEPFEVVNGATAIETINNEQADNAWYTLEGVRVMAPVKGLYIHNGKKVMVK